MPSKFVADVSFIAGSNLLLAQDGPRGGPFSSNTLWLLLLIGALIVLIAPVTIGLDKFWRWI